MKFEHRFDPNLKIPECMGDVYFNFQGNERTESVHFNCIRSEYEMLVSFIDSIMDVNEQKMQKALAYILTQAVFPFTDDFPVDYNIVVDGKVRTSDYIKDVGRWRHPTKTDYATKGSHASQYETVIRKRHE